MAKTYTQELPIRQSVYKNLDQQTVRNTFLTELYDGYQNEAGHILGRPGLREWFDIGIDYPVDCLYWWRSQSKLLAICNGIMYDIDYTASPVTKTALTGDKPTALNNIIIAEAADGAALMIADGGKMIRWPYSGAGGIASFITDADAPTTVSHVLMADRYLICNKIDSGSFQWSDVNDEEAYNALSKADAEGATDNIMAILKLGNDIIPIGSNTTEFFYDDGSTPWVSKKLAINVGTSAKYSCINVGSTIYFLDNNRNFVRMVGSATPETLSYPMKAVIDDLSTVADCVASFVNIKSAHLIQLQFPTDKVTLMYDYGLDKWYNWGWWNVATPGYDAFIGKNHCYIETENLHLVGDRKNTGKIYKLDPTYYTDNGDIIRTMVQTGHIDWETGNRKKNKELQLYFKRGEGNTDVTEPVCELRFRDNINGSWSSWIQLSLGKEGSRGSMARLIKLGIYETRQYQIAMSHPAEFIFLKAVEVFEVLRR